MNICDFPSRKAAGKGDFNKVLHGPFVFGIICRKMIDSAMELLLFGCFYNDLDIRKQLFKRY